MRQRWLLVTAIALASQLACGSSKYPPKPNRASDPPNSACEGSQACRMWGWCSERNNECVANTEESCRASEACKLGGLCSLVGTRCVARTAEDCDRSEWCKKFGYCSQDEGVCKD